MAEETKPRARSRARSTEDDGKGQGQHVPTVLTDVIPVRELAPGLEHNSSGDPCPPYAVA